MKWIAAIIVLLVFSGCGACSVAPLPQHQRPTISAPTNYQIQVRDGTFDKVRPQPYPDDFPWYLMVNYEVWEDDPQSDLEILAHVIAELRLGHRDKIQEPIRVKKGKVEVVGLTVYRAQRMEGRVGSYSSGIVVSIDDLFDLQKRADQIVEDCNLHRQPVTSGRDAMMDEYHLGRFPRTRS